MESAFLKWQESSVWASGAFWEYPYAQLFVNEAIIKNVISPLFINRFQIDKNITILLAFFDNGVLSDFIKLFLNNLNLAMNYQVLLILMWIRKSLIILGKTPLSKKENRVFLYRIRLSFIFLKLVHK